MLLIRNNEVNSSLRGFLNRYVINAGVFRHVFLYTTISCFPILITTLIGSLIIFFLLFRGQKILINYGNGLFTIQDLATHFQEMEIIVPDLHMCIVIDLHVIELTGQAKFTYRKTCIFHC